VWQREYCVNLGGDLFALCCSVVVNASECIEFSVYLVTIVYHEPEYDDGALGGQGDRTDVGIKTSS